MNTEQLIDYQNMLSSEFLARQARNPHYSLRAFARDLGLSASKVSEIMGRKCGISIAAATRIAQILRLTDAEREFFITSAAAQHSRSMIGKKNAAQKLDLLKPKQSFSAIELETFQVISDWFHFAILELTRLKEFKPDVAWIASRLRVSEADVTTALERLLRLGFLKQEADGRLIEQEPNVATPTDIPSPYIRRYQAQIMTKAIHSLEDASVEERDISSIVLAIPVSQLPKAKQMIRDFRRTLAREVQSNEPADRVYALGVQLFPCDFPNQDPNQDGTVVDGATDEYEN